MRRAALVVWLAVVIAVGGALGSRSAKAQQGCDMQCFCSCSNNQRGHFYWYFCVAPCQWCGGGADGGCETDYCGGSCGDGFIAYCQWFPICGQYPRCMGIECR